MLKKNWYTWGGLGLIVAGCLVSLSAYFIFLLTWLTALGISMLILAIIFLVLGRTIPELSPEVSGLLLETGIENITSMIEELGIRTKAIYLPSSLTGSRPQALVPLDSKPAPPAITKALPQRLIVQYGDSADDVGLLVNTAGTTAVTMLESIPGASPAELESSLTSLFTGILGVADGASVVYRENRIVVEIRNPRIESKDNWSHRCLGGLLASMVASLVAEALNSPVIIKQEEQKRGKAFIELEVLG